jgi:methylase of polypeptide subunit release factors
MIDENDRTEILLAMLAEDTVTSSRRAESATNETRTDHPQIGSARLSSCTLSHGELRAIGRLIRDSLDPTRTDSPLRAVLKGQEVGRSTLLHQLTESRLERFCSCGLLVESGQRVFSPFRAHLVEGLVIVTDPASGGQPRSPWYLDPLCEGSQLARLLIRKSVGWGLDMGCGCGVLSLVMSSFCEQVTGLDLNPRAIEISGFNAQLNGIVNVTFMESDLFNSVHEQKFELIVFNSPTNKEGGEYRDLLETGEPLLVRFFSSLGKHLEARGYCQINLAMNDYPQSRFVDRLASWIKAGENDLSAIIMVCEYDNQDDGRIWKRGWATFRLGRRILSEVEWPYRSLPPTSSPVELSQLVLQLFENHELLNSQNQIPQLTWSDGLCCILPGRGMLGLWGVPLARVPGDILLGPEASLSFFENRDWIDLCLRKGLLGVSSDI